MGEANQVAYEFAEAWTWREKLRWLLADKCAGAENLPVLLGELTNHFGLSITLQTLKNYARVSKSFEEEHRHLQYKWSNYLEWSKWENPVEAMTTALDRGYGPTQMARLRRYGDPEYKKPKPELCQVCRGELGHCRHDDWMNLGTVEFPDGGKIEVDYQEDSTTVTIDPDVGFSGGPEPIDPGELKVLRMAHGYDKGQTGGLEQRDSELEGPAEDRQEAVSPAQEVRE